tara:strand:+ start:151 stop:597 length:447 start_codon:yes stop_codon:yes gene_type:complete
MKEESKERINTDVTDRVITPKTRRKKGFSKNGVRLGRPTKEAVKKAKLPVGRPREDKGIIEEYKRRMIASPKSAKVLEAILDVASDPDHKAFTACAKLVVDRLLPISSFEDAKNSGKASINITITGVDGAVTNLNEEATEAEYTTVTE